MRCDVPTPCDTNKCGCMVATTNVLHFRMPTHVSNSDNGPHVLSSIQAQASLTLATTFKAHRSEYYNKRDTRKKQSAITGLTPPLQFVSSETSVPKKRQCVAYNFAPRRSWDPIESGLGWPIIMESFHKPWQASNHKLT